MRNRRIWGREATHILWADAVFAEEGQHESQRERVGGDGMAREVARSSGEEEHEGAHGGQRRGRDSGEEEWRW